RKLPRKVMPFLVEHEIDPLTDVFGDRDARLGIEQLELLVLFGRDVDGRGDLLPRHDMTMHDHRSTVKDGGELAAPAGAADLMNRAFRPTVAPMLMSMTRALLIVSAAVSVAAGAGCGSSPKHSEMVSNAGNGPASPLIDRDKCNDRDKHVVTADTDQDKK